MFNERQIRNIAKYFWQLSIVLVQSGALAGILLPKVPVAVVFLAITMSGLSAVIAVIVDSFARSD